MVARGHHVYSGFEQFVSCGRRYTQPAGDILGVGYHKVDIVLFAQVREQLLHRQPSRPADYISDC
jgi:hypothetical protein